MSVHRLSINPSFVSDERRVYPLLGNVLYDTGIAADWNETWPEQFRKDCSFHRLESLTAKLQGVGQR